MSRRRKRHPIARLFSGIADLVGSIHRRALQTSRHRLILRSGIHQIDQMDGIEFEDYLEALFASQGYTVKRTPISHDYGADLILRKHSQTIAVQAKRYDTAVGLGAVQEAVAAMSVYHCASAMVVTNNRFTRSAHALAKSNGVVLWDRDTLMTQIVQTPGHQQPKPLPPIQAPTARPQPDAFEPRERSSALHGYLIEQRTGRVVSLAKTPVLIGRDPANDLVIDSKSVSRSHAKIILERDRPQLVLVDLDSRNGTCVNGVRINRCVLKAGDVIQIEQAMFTFSLRPFLRL